MLGISHAVLFFSDLTNKSVYLVARVNV